MPDREKKKWYQLDGRSLSNLVLICAGVLLYLGLTHLPQVRRTMSGILDVLSPFIIGFAIAYLLNTPTKFFSRNLYSGIKKPGLRQGLSILTVYAIAVVILTLLLQLVIPQVGDSISRLASNISYYLENLDQMVETFIQLFGLEGENINDLMESYDELVRRAASFLSTSIPGLLNFGVAVGNGVVTAITAIIVSVYMLLGKERLIYQVKKLLYALFAPKGVQRILAVGSRANAIFVGFINGKLIDSAIMGVLCFLLSSLLRIPYAILVSVIVGVTNIIPFFGPIIGAVPCLMILVLVNPWAALRFGILIVVLQQFDGNVLGPMILGDSTGLSAIWVLVAILLGGGFFGFPGMLLGVPTFAVLYSLIRDWANIQLEKKGIDANGEPLEQKESPTHQ